MNLIFVNGCIREKDSRTLKIALEILKDKEHEEIDLNQLDLLPYNYANNPVMHPIEPRFVEISDKIANSDGVIIAAPFWDMSFPSLLKVFLEKLSLNNIMFRDNGETCLGIAKCPFMFYVTTRGMDIPDGDNLEQATPYLKALCHLWGINKFDFVSAHNLDYISPQEVEKRLMDASSLGKEKINVLLNEKGE